MNLLLLLTFIYNKGRPIIKVAQQHMDLLLLLIRSKFGHSFILVDEFRVDEFGINRFIFGRLDVTSVLMMIQFKNSGIWRHID